MSERRKLRILILLGALVVLLVAIGGPLWTARNEYLATPVIVTGTITNTAGTPLKAISVQVYRWSDHQWNAKDAMETDARGHFRFTGLPAGRYTVAFEDDSGVGYLGTWWGGSVVGSKAKYRQLSPGMTATIDTHVTLGAAITGHATVTDPDRGRIDATQFSITAYPVVPKAGGGESIRWTASISSLDPTAGGNWRIQNLPTGSYVLQAIDNDEYPARNALLGARWVGVPIAAGYSLGQWRRAKVFTVVDGSVYSAPSVDLTYQDAHPSPALIVKVVDVDGRPIAGARVDLRLTGAYQFTFDSGVHGAPVTNSAGELGVYRATPGVYAVTVRARGYATLAERYRFDQGESGEAMTTVVLDHRLSTPS